MTYAEYAMKIQDALRKKKTGATWSELKALLDLPYHRPCPEWTRRLESETGLARRKGPGRELIWSYQKTKARDV